MKALIERWRRMAADCDDEAEVHLARGYSAPARTQRRLAGLLRACADDLETEMLTTAAASAAVDVLAEALAK